MLIEGTILTFLMTGRDPNQVRFIYKPEAFLLDADCEVCCDAGCLCSVMVLNETNEVLNPEPVWDIFP
jgi:hypothetical protein